MDVALLAHVCASCPASSRGRRSTQEETDGSGRKTLCHAFQRYREIDTWQSVILDYEQVRAIRDVTQAASVPLPRRRWIARVNHDLNLERREGGGKGGVEVFARGVGLDSGNDHTRFTR
jgi:hypothetical protein